MKTKLTLLSMLLLLPVAARAQAKLENVFVKSEVRNSGALALSFIRKYWEKRRDLKGLES